MKSRVADIVRGRSSEIGDPSARDGRLQPRSATTPRSCRSPRSLADLAGRAGLPPGVDHRSHRRSGAGPIKMIDTAPARGLCRSRVPLPGWRSGGRAKTGQPSQRTVNPPGRRWRGQHCSRRAAPDVGTLLADAVPLLQSDSSVPAASAPVVDGMRITVTRIRRRQGDPAVAPGAPPGASMDDRTHEHEAGKGDRRSGRPVTQRRDVCCPRVNGAETGRRPPGQPGHHSGPTASRVGTKPGTVPPVDQGARWDAIAMSRVATGAINTGPRILRRFTVRPEHLGAQRGLRYAERADLATRGRNNRSRSLKLTRARGLRSLARLRWSALRQSGY